jgi:RNA polymerase sigma-70 factor (ECF subfamily)
MHFDPRLRTKMDDSDLVQQTFLQAHRALGDFRGKTEEELAAWLRQIRNLTHAARDYRRVKRNVAREKSIQAAVDESSARLEAWLVAELPTPSQRVQREEDLFRLAAAVERLPPAQREAIELHYWQHQTLSEVAQQLGRSSSAVAGLLHRGLKALKKELRAESDEP